MSLITKIYFTGNKEGEFIYDNAINQDYLEQYHEKVYKRYVFLLYLGVIYSLLLFFNNFFWPDSSFNKNQLLTFRISDTIVLIVSVFLIAIEFFRKSRNFSVNTGMYRYLVDVFVGFYFIWGAVTSCVELQLNDYLFTYYITLILFISIIQKPAINYGILCFLPFLILLFFMAFNKTAHDISAYHFISVTILTLVGIYISNVLYISDRKSFFLAEKMKQNNEQLDLIVSARTEELENVNAKLIGEIDVRKQYEELLKEESKRAQEADKLKTTFLTNLSHEIRTLLNGIMGFSQLLGSKKLTDVKRAHYTEVIQKNSSQLLKIIEDIIDFSMLESEQVKLNVEEFKLEQLMVSLYEQYDNIKKGLNKEQIEVKYHFPNDSAVKILKTDRGRLEQVFQNLLDNALKFTSEGLINFGYMQEDDFLIFYVEDTGIGIPDENIKYIFKHFAQGDHSLSRKHGGNGLGLPISRGIVSVFGGEIWLDKTYTKGARFCFSHPL